jgi:lactaldehyde dehydrogenase/glycolaldehyde dehydrogenase
VLADANLDLAVKAIRDSRIINTGQVCNCAERVYVERPVAERFIDKISKAMSATRTGDSLEDSTVGMGPLVKPGGVRQGGWNARAGQGGWRRNHRRRRAR